VSLRLAAAAVLATAAVALVAAWALELSLERVVLLAPVIVFTAAALGGLLVLWGRVVYESLRRQRHPGRIVAGALAAVALIVVLTLLGVQLPRE
jgi:hypothetical protein